MLKFELLVGYDHAHPQRELMLDGATE